MKTISKLEYKELWNQFRLAEWDKIKDSPHRPNGMFGVWGWHLQKEREFKQILKVQGVEIDEKN